MSSQAGPFFLLSEGLGTLTGSSRSFRVSKRSVRVVLVAATLGVPDGSSSVCCVLCVEGSYWKKMIKKKPV